MLKIFGNCNYVIYGSLLIAIGVLILGIGAFICFFSEDFGYHMMLSGFICLIIGAFLDN